MFTTFAASTVSPWITSNLYFGLSRFVMNRLVQSHFVALAHARTQHLFVAQSRHTNTFRLVSDPPTNTQVIFAVKSTAFITALSTSNDKVINQPDAQLYGRVLITSTSGTESQQWATL